MADMTNDGAAGAGDQGADAGTDAAAAAAAAAAAGTGDKGTGADAGQQGGDQGTDAAAAAAAAGGEGAEGGEGGEQPKSVWPENWRQLMAKERTGKDSGPEYDKAVQRLARFKGPESVGRSFFELDYGVNSGELRRAKPFPSDGTPEQQAAWRQENELPATPEGYNDALEGITIGEADRPLVDEFLAMAHEGNVPPAQVAATIDWYFKAQERQLEAQNERDVAYVSESGEALRATMGADFKVNMNDLKKWLGPPGRPEEPSHSDLILGARMADGTRIGDNPEVVNLLVSRMREIYPNGTVTGNLSGGGLAEVDIKTEIAGYEKRMAEDPTGWSKDSAARERHRQLLQLQINRGGAAS